MRFLKGISILTFIVGVLSGVVIHRILILDFPFYMKAVSVSLLVLSALLLFVNEREKGERKFDKS